MADRSRTGKSSPRWRRPLRSAPLLAHRKSSASINFGRFVAPDGRTVLVSDKTTAPYSWLGPSLARWEAWVYTCVRVLTDLYVVEGVR